MNKLTCKNCGAPINPETYMCEYCKTSYKDPVMEFQKVMLEERLNEARNQLILNRFKLVRDEAVNEIFLQSGVKPAWMI